MSTSSSGSNSSNELDAAIASWIQAVERGEGPDRESFLKQYAHLSDELRQFLDDYEFLNLQTAGVEKVPVSPQEPPAGPASEIDAALTLTFLSPIEQAADKASRTLPRIRYFGDYELLREIARGGMGVVYEARQRSLNRPVALKMILAGQFAGQEEVTRFRREAEAAAQLEHPGIVPIYEIGTHGDQHYFTMGYVAGTSLSTRLMERPLEPREAAALIRDVAIAVHYAHEKGVVHRDLKPSNILLAPLIDGKPGEFNYTPRVTDFGLAKISRSDQELTETGQILGTPSYMPPEQAGGRVHDVGPAADIYALGAMLYSCLTGRPPFQAASAIDTIRQVMEREPVSLRELNAAIPQDLETISLKCLEKSIPRRYPSGKAVADELQRYLDGRPIDARPVSYRERAWRWCRRNPVIAGLTAAVAASLVFGIVVSSHFAWKEAEQAEKNRKLAIAKGELAKKNGDLAAEKGRLAEEKTKLASDEQKARADAEAKAAALRSSLAANCFARGVAETKAGRYQSGVVDLQRAWMMTPESDPLKVHYQAVLYDRARVSGRLLTPVLRHERGVHLVVFSPQGDRVLSGSSDGTARLWDARTGVPAGKPLRHGQMVTAVAFSAEGDRILTGSVDKTARLWETRTSAPLGEPMPHEHVVSSVAFLSRSNRVVTGSLDGTARLWDAQTGVPLAEPMRHNKPVLVVACSPDGDRVLTGSADNTAQLWEAGTGAPLGEPMRHSGQINAVAFNADGKWILTGSQDGTARLWDAQTGSPLAEPMRHLSSPVEAVAFNPQGDRFLTGSWSGARLWNAQTGTQLGEIMHYGNAVRCVAFSPQGDRALTASNDGTARLWDARTGDPLGEPMYNGEVAAAAFSPHGECVVTGGDGARLWDARAGAPVGKTIQLGDRVRAVATSPQGDRILAGHVDGTARLWDVRTGVPLGEPMRHSQMVTAVACSPLGDFVLTKTSDTVRMWNPLNGIPLGEPMRHEDLVQAVAFSPQGDRVLTGSSDNSARLWDARTGAPVGKPMQHDGWVRAVAFSPHGDRVLTGSTDNTARQWDARTGIPIGEPMRHSGEVKAVRFSPKGDRILTASSDGTARLWETQTCAPTAAKPMLYGGARIDHDHGIQFSPQGDRVLTVSHKEAWLFDANTGSLLGEAMRHEQSIDALSFSPQGDRILTGSRDQTARLWDARTGASLGEPMRHEIYGVDAATFISRGDRVLTVSDFDGTMRQWDVRYPRLPNLFSDYCELMSQCRVDADGNIHRIEYSDWLKIWKKLQAQEPDWMALVQLLNEDRATQWYRSAALETLHSARKKFDSGYRFASRSYAMRSLKTNPNDQEMLDILGQTSELSGTREERDGFKKPDRVLSLIHEIRNNDFAERLLLTDEQKQKFDQLRKDQRSAASEAGGIGVKLAQQRQEFEQKAVDLLTDEQMKIWVVRQAELRAPVSLKTMSVELPSNSQHSTFSSRGGFVEPPGLGFELFRNEENFAKQMNLTKEQQQKLNVLEGQYREKLSGLGRRERDSPRSALPALQREFDQKAMDLLTDDQKKMWAERQEKLKTELRNSLPVSRIGRGGLFGTQLTLGLRRNELLAKQLNLTDEQKQKLNELEMERKQSIRKLSLDGGVESVIRDALTKVITEFDQKSVDLLTDDQKKIWAERQQELSTPSP